MRRFRHFDVTANPSEGMVVGTPAYIAPEQIVDPRSADARSDIYGLGCTLYHLLAGKPIFADDSISDILAAQQYRMPESIPACRKGSQRR